MKKETVIIIIVVAILVIIIYLKRVEVKETVMGAIIPANMIKFVNALKDAAKKDGYTLVVNSGLRTFNQQLALRRKNVIDKSKVSDDIYLKTAPSTAFKPQTAKPGTSNHESGIAFDFSTIDNPLTPENEAAYKWLVKNAINFGFVRTVPSERWHWEYRPTAKQFAYVPQSNPTWDKLV